MIKRKKKQEPQYKNDMKPLFECHVGRFLVKVSYGTDCRVHISKHYFVEIYDQQERVYSCHPLNIGENEYEARDYLLKIIDHVLVLPRYVNEKLTKLNGTSF